MPVFGDPQCETRHCRIEIVGPGAERLCSGAKTVGQRDCRHGKYPAKCLVVSVPRGYASARLGAIAAQRRNREMQVSIVDFSGL